MRLNYQEASRQERMNSAFVGDPIGGDYYGQQELQQKLWDYEDQYGKLGELALESPAVMDTVEASVRLAEIMSPTPIEYAPNLSTELATHIYLKREDRTPVRSFKLRGAYNKIAQFSDEEKERGVLAASAGNHAQGVALSAKELGIDSTIVMPLTTPAIKVGAVRSLGSEVILAGDNYSDAYDHSQELLAVSGQVFIHPFDDIDVIRGQGTIGKEILDDLPNTTHIFVPIGGGGLISGIAEYVKGVSPDTKIIGVEPTDSNAMQASLKAGYPIELDHVGKFADGVAVRQVGRLTFEICQQYVDEVILVSNDQIAAATEDFYNETRSIIEPAAALSIAGIRHYAINNGFTEKDEAVAVCSGANMNLRTMQFIAERNEIGSGRKALFAISLPEQPGALHKLCKEVVDSHNITELKYRLHTRAQAHIFVGFSVVDTDDKQKFMEKLETSDHDFTDLSDDELAKEHIVHLVGGKSQDVLNETLYNIQFPERPGALTDFLESVGDQCNISLFDYRSLGGDTGQVLIGFENPNRPKLEDAFKRVRMDFQLVESEAAKLFL